MRRFACVFAILLTANAAAAQTAAGKPPEWPRLDVNLSAGFFEAQPDGASHDQLRQTGIPKAATRSALGYYWTENFKTEIEFATTGEGSRYVQDFDSLPGTPQQYPYSYESFHRLQQTSRARGLAVPREHVGASVCERRRGVSRATGTAITCPRNTVIRRSTHRSARGDQARVDSGKLTDHRGGVTFGGGAKFYMTPQTLHQHRHAGDTCQTLDHGELHRRFRN